ncbi:MAG TPA: 30S ribosome-binding factor RbfA [Candidatus Eisenbacteria bacterium]|nr:30S ribosome-binding factor RbfA [Candidatus Eisenbacteria bacterium]
MENRAQKYQRARRSEALREEITLLVEGELEDPRIGLVTVNEVHLAPDGKLARVFVAVSGSDDEVAESLEGLNASRGFIRHALVANLGLRHAPELVFVLDQSEQYGSRVEELLQRIEKRKRHS